MIAGTVKWFDVKKGFGFIAGPEGQDVFVHFSSIVGDGFRTLKDGEAVEYELLEGDKGFHAREVKRIGASAAFSHGNGLAAAVAQSVLAEPSGVFDEDGPGGGFVGRKLPYHNTSGRPDARI